MTTNKGLAKGQPKKSVQRKPTNRHFEVTRESELRKLLVQLCEHYPISRFVENSYVLSRFWAWYSQIEFGPEVRIPVPRYLTVRDP